MALYHLGSPSLHRARRRVRPALRAAVLARDGHLCRYCGDYATDVDHVLPVTAGGRNREDNLVASCRFCNAVAFNHVFDSFDERLAYVQRRIGLPWIKALKQSRLKLCHCADCGELFQPRVDGATALLCGPCAANDERGVNGTIVELPGTGIER